MNALEQTSSCVAVFSNYDDAKRAIAHMVDAGIESRRISLVGEQTQEGLVARGGMDRLDEDLTALGVQEANLHCYKCLIYGGSWLVIVSGNHEQVDFACEHLEKHTSADVSLHFNAQSTQAHHGEIQH